MATKINYTKLRNGNWGVAVPTGILVQKGSIIKVTKKSGETKEETIDTVIWTGNGVQLCAIVQSHSSTNRNGGRYAPYGRVCDYCGSRECARAWNPRDLCDED